MKFDRLENIVPTFFMGKKVDLETILHLIKVKAKVFNKLLLKYFVGVNVVELSNDDFTKKSNKK